MNQHLKENLKKFKTQFLDQLPGQTIQIQDLQRKVGKTLKQKFCLKIKIELIKTQLQVILGKIVYRRINRLHLILDKNFTIRW